MKPHELIRALMALDGGSLQVAKKMKRPGMQGTLHKFAHGNVTSPTRATAEALASYFKLPVDAIYDEKVATAIARERNISALPPAIVAATLPSKKADNLLAQLRKLPTAERARILREVGAMLGKGVDAAPTDGEALGGDSAWGRLENAPTFDVKKGSKK